MKTKVVLLGAVSVLMAACSQSKPAATAAADAGALAPAIHASMQDIMGSLNEPNADAIWNSVSTVSDEKGVHEFKPTTDEDWAKLRTAAVGLVEASNLMVMKGRPLLSPGKEMEEGGTLTAQQIQAKIDTDHAAFAASAKQFQDAGVAILAAIEARDVARLEEAGGPLDEACEQCHLQFWYPPAPEPAAKDAPKKS